MSATSKRTPARKSGGGSRVSKPKTFKFRGVELVTPKEIPGTFGFDYGEIQMLGQNEDPAVLGATHRLLESLIGHDELAKVRPVVKGISDPWQIELLNAVLDGLDLGEA